MLPNTNLNNRKFILSKSPEIIVKLKDEILYGGYFAALSGPAFIITSSILTGTSISLPLLIIAYIIPLMVYSYDHYRDMDKDKDSNLERATYFHKKSRIFPYLMGSYVIILSLLLVFFSNLTMISFILILIMGGVLYSVGLKNFTQKIPAFKNIYTTLTWSLAGTFSIVFYHSLQLNLIYILIFLFVFLKFLPNTIFFDLKDIKSDRKEGLKTVPVILGKKGTLKLLHILNILAFIPLFVGIYLGIIPLFAAIMVLFYFYSVYYLNKASKLEDEKLRMVSYTLADAEFMIWPIVLVLGQFLFSVI
ncbi:MAG: prenyltransferase [Methanobacterium sp. PtaU1.Bin097]|jgi:4-hydroxybenzoate polyprenyltransferase|nr:MAG: prenyltransferase [Methanobacterium sp. PtaU1.Bin097]